MTGFLASFFYFKQYPFEGHPGPLILDSGAFSAYTLGKSIDLDEYGDWAGRVSVVAPGFAWALNLDVIGNAEASFDQWCLLQSGYAIDFVPVIHHGGDFKKEIDRYLEHGVTRLAFGGMVGGGQRNLPWAAACLKYLEVNAPDVLTHGLGVVEGSVSSRLPWDSTDSSAGTAANRFGSLALVAPGGRGGFTKLDVRSGIRPTRHESELIRSYGVDPATLRDSDGPARNAALARLAWRTVVREEQIENRRRAATRARLQVERPRPVIRYVVNGNLLLSAHIRDEMEHPYTEPRQGPGVLRDPATAR
jgi:hypothetical protein